MKNFLRLWLCLILAGLLSPHAMADKKPPAVVYERVVEHYSVGTDLRDENISETMIRIETLEGVESRAEQEFTYSKTYQELEVLEAYTLQPDGTKIPVPPSSIRERVKKTDSNRLTDWVTRVILFPEVKIGSRLYSKVIRRTHTQQYPGHFSTIDTLPLTVKTEHAEYHLTHDASVPIRVGARNLEGGLLSDQDDGRKRYRYTGSQLNPITGSSNDISNSDVAPQFYATTFQSWGQLGETYYRRAAVPESLPADIVALAGDLTQGNDSPRAQAQAIHQWVTQNIHYVSLTIDDGGLVPRPLETILANRFGDCKDQARLFQALLKARGIDSEPVLINQGRSYVLPELVVDHSLNHVITYIPSLDVYVDTTRAMAPFGELGSGLMGKPVILTRSGTVARTPFTPGKRNQSVTIARMRIANDGSITGEGEARLTGWLGILAREQADGSPEQRVRIRLELERLSGTGKIVSSDPRDLLSPYRETFDFALDPTANLPGPGAFTIPVALTPYSMSDLAVVLWPQKQEIPSVCTSRGIVEDYAIRLPDSIRVRHIPKATRYRDGVIDYRSSYRLAGRTLHVKRMLDVSRPIPVCGQQEQDRWREFQAVLRRDLRAQVVYD